jgi:hypothetical protein
MLLAGFATMSLAVWPALLAQNFSHHDRLAADWTNLFEHCRTSIEMNVPLVSTAGQIDGSGDPILGSPEAGVTTLSYTNGWFEARHQEHGEGAALRSTCSIALRDESKLLDTDELATVLFAFIRLRQQLLEAGSHEFKDLGILQPATTAAFALRDKNSRGCSTNAYISIDALAQVFSNTVGEQTTPCAE